MKKWIKVTKEERKVLEKIFDVKERTVFNALGFVDPENDKHKRIRKAALEHGGIVLTELPVKEMIHLSHEGIMRGVLDNGAVVEFYRKDGSGKIFFKGEEIARYENVDIPMIYTIQERAATLS